MVNNGIDKNKKENMVGHCPRTAPFKKKTIPA